MILDAHQHFWKPERGDYGWLTPELKTLYRDFLPHDLKPILDDCGVSQTILVQAAPTLEETRFMLELAREHDFIAGVVGWVDFESPEAPDTAVSLAADPLLVGLRPMIQDIADPDWILRPGNEPVFRAMANQQLVLDALVLPVHLNNLQTVVERHPDLRIVIDHAAKPPIRETIPESWFIDMEALSTFPNVTCKLSGLITEAAHDWSPVDMRTVIDHLLATFGADRLIWGSDWPVVNLAGDYQQWLKVATDALDTLSTAEQSAIFGRNAARIYLST